MKLKRLDNCAWKIEQEGNMKAPCIIYASENIINHLKKDKSIEQIINVSTLDGIVKASYAMPDAHQGYGFSIGGVAAFDTEKGIISPGGVGFDINCGVRLISTNLKEKEVLGKRKELLKLLFKEVPTGVGSDGRTRFTDEELKKFMINGSKEAIDRGFGWPEDIERTEDFGKMNRADPNTVSLRAYKRGRAQLGSLGAGNHFLEIQKVDKIFDTKTAKAFDITEKGQIMIMIHCGSRGLGHQIASDYIRLMEKEYGFSNLADRNLINAPFNSELGQKYFSAMCSAANYAWANRQIITHHVRETFSRVFQKTAHELEMNLVYDVTHNIAKIEKHIVNGSEKTLIVHRKGATRSFGPNRKELSGIYKKTGQPVLIPGSMGTSSYVMAGTDKSENLSFGSSAHGAGRVMSRHNAMKDIKEEAVRKQLAESNIDIISASRGGIVEEAPETYKDIEEVIKISNEAGLCRLVAKLKPLGVIKG